MLPMHIVKISAGSDRKPQESGVSGYNEQSIKKGVAARLRYAMAGE